MKTSQTGLNLIERYEGLILGAYDDANDHIVQPGQAVRGTLTIGYGHTNAAGPPRIKVGDRITKVQAEQYLASDLAKVEADVTRLVKVPLNQNQFDALVSFQYNTGSLGRSSLLQRLNGHDYKGASQAFMAYTRGRQDGKLVQMSGLVRRRKDEVALFNKPYTSTVITPKTTTGAVVAGGAGAVAAAPQYWHYIIPATIVALIIGGIAFYFYEKGKK